MNTSQQYLQIAEEVAAEIRTRAVSGIRDILLYGSVARGDATEASDIDMLVVYDDEDQRRRETSERVAADMMEKHSTLIGILDCGPAEYQRLMKFPFGWQVKKEGVHL